MMYAGRLSRAAEEGCSAALYGQGVFSEGGLRNQFNIEGFLSIPTTGITKGATMGMLKSAQALLRGRFTRGGGKGRSTVRTFGSLDIRRETLETLRFA